MLCREEEQRRQSHAPADEERMFQRDIKAMPQWPEDGDMRPRRSICKCLRAAPHLPIDETHPPVRTRGLGNAEGAAQKAAVCRYGDLDELPGQSRSCNLRSGERQDIDARNRRFVGKNPCLLDHLRQGHPLRRHNPESRVYRPDGDSA